MSGAEIIRRLQAFVDSLKGDIANESPGSAGSEPGINERSEEVPGAFSRHLLLSRNGAIELLWDLDEYATVAGQYSGLPLSDASHRSAMVEIVARHVLQGQQLSSASDSGMTCET